MSRLITSLTKVLAVLVVSPLLLTVPGAADFAVAKPEPSVLLAQTRRKTTADKLFQEGFAQYQTNQFQAALQLWQQALEVYQELQDTTGEQSTSGALGAAYLALGDYKQAISFAQTSRALSQRINDRQSEAQALGNLAIAYEATGSYVEAIKSSEQALTIVKDLKDRQAEGQILGNLGNIHEALGDYDKATQSYEQSLSIAQQLKDRVGERYALTNLGTIFASLGEHDKAIEHYRKSLAIAQKIGNIGGEASTLINLGSAYYAQGKPNEASQYYKNSLEVATSSGDSKLVAEALVSVGLSYEEQHNYPKAVQHYQESLEIARKRNDPRMQALALNNLGHALLNSGKLVEAEQALRVALKLLDTLRSNLDDTYKVSVFDTQVLTYNLLQQVLIAQKKPGEALEIAEWGRARAFVELMAERYAQPGDATKNPSLRLAATPPTLQQIQQIAKAQKATLVEYSIIPDDEFKFQGKQRGLEGELLIWVVQPTGEVAIRRFDLKTFLKQLPQDPNDELPAASKNKKVLGLSDFVILVRNSLFSDNPEYSTTKLKQLHQVLIQPISDLLPRDPNARVIFVPQESLFLVPFPALINASGKYLIEQHTLLTVPAIQMLELTHQKRQRIRNGGRGNTPSESLVVGNPKMPSIPSPNGGAPQRLDPLPGSEAEAKEVAQILKAQAIIGDKATKAEVMHKMLGAKVIHLATHGLLDNIVGLGIPGSLALAPFKNDSGLLSAKEVLNLNLNAELVVLSACDTGRGRITGDGVIGMSRSFITAGATSLVVTLWKIPDESAAFLMPEFYRQLQQTSDKAIALRQAMLKTIKQHPEPRHWSAFTLIGESE